nr:sensor histidine kinase [Bacillus massiliigorillae]
MRKEVLLYSFVQSSNLELIVWSLFFIGILFTVSFFQSNLYIKRPDDKVPLYFSFYIWTIIISMVLMIIPYGDWFLLLKLIYICNYMSLYFFHIYISAFLHKQAHRLLTMFIIICVSVLTVLTMFNNFDFIVKLFQLNSMLYFCYFIYLLYVTWRKFREKQKQIIWVFISVIIIVLTGFQHQLVIYHVIEEVSQNGLGIFLFLLIHSVLNMERFLNSYSETVEMKQLLQEKVKERTVELERANVEMRSLQNEKSQIISDICHDLSNPITSIGMISKGMLEEVIPVTNKQYLVEILNKSSLMEKLLGDLRQLNMLENNQIHFHLEKVDWYDYMKRIFTDYDANLQSEDIKYKLHMDKVPKQNAEVLIDPLRMEQVYFNIISNSIKYTPVGGSVEVSVGLDYATQQAFLKVSDSGIGIDSSQLHLIYDRFYRTEPIKADKESTGLGLNIVKSIISRHEGSINVESEKGKGTTFIIRIPLAV